MIAFIKRAWALHKEEKLKLVEVAERRFIAATFNRRYTYRVEYVKGRPQLSGNSLGGALFNPTAGNAWMCPECNVIHFPYESSMFSGLQYPACCKHPAGHRLYEGIPYR